MQRLAKPDSLIVVDTPRRLVSTGEAARATGLSARTIARYAADGRLRPAQILPGRTRRTFLWDLDDLRRQLDELHRQAE